MKTYGFVHAEYGDRYRKQSIQMLAQFRRQLTEKGDSVSLVVVDSASTSPEEAWQSTEFESAFATGGDSSNRDFSGWDKGVAATLARGVQPDIWVFSNDTVARNHGWGSQKIAHYARQQSRLHVHTGPWLFGEIHDFPRSLVTPLGPQLEWVSSYLFAMNETLRSRLGTLSPGNALLDALMRDRFEPGRGLFGEGVDPAYAAHMSAWLIEREGETRGKPTYKWYKATWLRSQVRAFIRGKDAYTWYKATPLTAETFDELRMKARCCISENMLSHRARQLGADIRSPYDARNGREHVRKSWQFVSDKIVEKLILRRQRS